VVAVPLGGVWVVGRVDVPAAERVGMALTPVGAVLVALLVVAG